MRTLFLKLMTLGAAGGGRVHGAQVPDHSGWLLRGGGLWRFLENASFPKMVCTAYGVYCA